MKFLALTVLLFALAGTEGFPNNELRKKRQTVEEVGTKVGCLVTRLHKVQGEVYYINNSSQLYIKDFTFDGQGLGVYFYVALEGSTRPFSRKNSVVVNWPNPASTVRTPVKKAFDSQDIVINLPAGISADKVVWVTLWCEEFGISFGDLVFNSKKAKENACAPGAKRAPVPAAANPALPPLLPGIGITQEQLSIILANPELLQQLQAQGLLLQLQALQG